MGLVLENAVLLGSLDGLEGHGEATRVVPTLKDMTYNKPSAAKTLIKTTSQPL